MREKYKIITLFTLVILIYFIFGESIATIIGLSILLIIYLLSVLIGVAKLMRIKFRFSYYNEYSLKHVTNMGRHTDQYLISYLRDIILTRISYKYNIPVNDVKAMYKSKKMDEYIQISKPLIKVLYSDNITINDIYMAIEELERWI